MAVLRNPLLVALAKPDSWGAKVTLQDDRPRQATRRGPLPPRQNRIHALTRRLASCGTNQHRERDLSLEQVPNEETTK